MAESVPRPKPRPAQGPLIPAPLTAPVKRASPNGQNGPTLLGSDFANFNKFANQIDTGLSKFSTALTDSIEGIVTPVQQAILNTTTAIDTGLGSAVVNARSVAQNISANIGSSINSIVAQVPAIGQINSFANQLNGSIANISNTINNIGGTIGGIGNVIGGATAGISSSLNNIGGAISSITGSGVGAAAGLSRAVGGVTGKLGGAISNLAAPFDRINQQVNQFNNRLSGGLQKINDRISNVTRTLDTVNTFLTNPGAIIQNKLNELFDAGLAKVLEPINQLINFGYNLANQINTATNIVTQELRNLTEYVGGIFTGIASLLTNALRGSDFYRDNELIYADGELIQTANGQKLLSPLRRFNHYNYIITLGILNVNELNDPTTYRDRGFSRVILQSGGGAYDRRIRTLEEGNDHMEYYIDDLEIDAVVAPNPNTGVTLGTTINFKIVEPYSMGKFIETIVLGAEETGHKQYMQAPYCLKIDFVGWNEDGDLPKKIQKPKYVPIMFTKMDFDVTEQGSTYLVKAVVFNEIALADHVNQSKTSIEASGRTVAEVLETNEDSVGRNLSSAIEKAEENGQIIGGDRYLICFPKTKTALYEAARGLGISSSSLTKSTEEQIATDVGSERTNITPDDPDAQTNVEVLYSSAPKIYQYLKAWANDDANINVIGKSPVWDDARATDRVPHPSAASAYDSENLLFNRQYAEVQTEGRTRPYDWHEGTKITTMIEDVLLSSSYIADSLTEDRDIPFVKWFRIETMVFMEPSTDAELQLGRVRRTYVYAVHPYFPDEAKVIAPSEAPRGNDDLKRKALKEYNYIYTGKNEDILDFNLNFNQAFYQNILANFAQGPENGAFHQTLPEDLGGSSVTTNKNSNPRLTDIFAELVAMVNIRNSRGGAEYEAGDYGVKRRIAESVHETIINSPLNMVTAEMEIWGDPYFIPTEQGNYSSSPAGPSLTRDSTMNYMQNEVLCIINFKTPLDYPINGFVMNMPELVRPFSGVFQIWAVTNKFAGGRFTQTLKLIRRSNQTSEPTTATKSSLVPSTNTLNTQPSGQPGAASGFSTRSSGVTPGAGRSGFATGGVGSSAITPGAGGTAIPPGAGRSGFATGGVGSSAIPPGAGRAGFATSTGFSVAGAQAAIDRATNNPTIPSTRPQTRPPTSHTLATPGSLTPGVVTVTTLPRINAPAVNLPRADLGGRTVYNPRTGRYESGY